MTAQRASMAPEKVEDVVKVNTNIRQLREFNMKKLSEQRYFKSS